MRRHEETLSPPSARARTVTTRLEGLPPREALAEAVVTARAAWVDAKGLVDFALTHELTTQARRDRAGARTRKPVLGHRTPRRSSRKQTRGIALGLMVSVHGGEELHEHVQARRSRPRERSETLHNARACRGRPPAGGRASRGLAQCSSDSSRRSSRARRPTSKPCCGRHHGWTGGVSSVSARETWRGVRGLSGGAKNSRASWFASLSPRCSVLNGRSRWFDDCLVNAASTTPARSPDHHRPRGRSRSHLFSCARAAFDRLERPVDSPCGGEIDSRACADRRRTFQRSHPPSEERDVGRSERQRVREKGRRARGSHAEERKEKESSRGARHHHANGHVPSPLPRRESHRRERAPSDEHRHRRRDSLEESHSM